MTRDSLLGTLLLACAATVLLVFTTEILTGPAGPPESRLIFVVRHPGTRSLNELVPDSSREVLGRQVSINSLGFRDREFSIAKPRGVVGVIGLGDD